jgi:hypothetical protein
MSRNTGDPSSGAWCAHTRSLNGSRRSACTRMHRMMEALREAEPHSGGGGPRRSTTRIPRLLGSIPRGKSQLGAQSMPLDEPVRIAYPDAIRWGLQLSASLLSREPAPRPRGVRYAHRAQRAADSPRLRRRGDVKRGNHEAWVDRG